MSDRDSGWLPVIAGGLLLLIGFAAFAGLMWFRAQQTKALYLQELRAIEAAKQAEQDAKRMNESSDASRTSDTSEDQVVAEPQFQTIEVEHTTDDNGDLLFPPEVEAAMMGEARQRGAGGILKSPEINLEAITEKKLQGSSPDTHPTIEKGD